LKKCISSLKDKLPARVNKKVNRNLLISKSEVVFILNVKILDPTNKNWLDYVNQNPAAIIFHHPAWMNLISDCYGFRAFIFTIVDENSEILSGLPVIEVRSGLTGHRWISLPYTDHCGVLATSKEYSDRLVHELAHVQILESILKYRYDRKLTITVM
jgi:hypothetical protein